MTIANSPFSRTALKSTFLSVEANGESLARWETPPWFETEVLGIYWHWGPYSVAGFGYSCWYGSSMYEPKEGPDYRGGDC